MTQTPYQPMRKPQKVLTQADMWETLAKHSGLKIEVQPKEVGETAQPELRPLQWCDPVRTGRLSGYLLSQCGIYSISKDVGVDDFITYTAWIRRTAKDKQDQVMLGCRTLLDEAKYLCQADADLKRRTKPLKGCR